MTSQRLRNALRGLALAVSASGLMSVAAPAADFAGKTVTLTIGHSAGGSYDLYARLFAQHVSRHLPGNPTVIVNHRTGAGTMNAANYLYAAAPRDGFVLGLTGNLLPFAQAVGMPGVRYDIREFQWLGNIARLVSVLVVWHTAPATTLDGIYKTEVVAGALARSTESYMVPAIMNAVLGTRFKIVQGYPGITQLDVAMERGETHVAVGAYRSYTARKPDWLQQKTVLPVVQIGLGSDPDLAGVPLLADLARTPADRQLIELVSSGSEFARAPYLPPGVPAAMVATWRAAFDATVADPRFLAAAKERRLDVAPIPADTLQQIAVRLLDTPKESVDRMRKILGIE